MAGVEWGGKRCPQCDAEVEVLDPRGDCCVRCEDERRERIARTNDRLRAVAACDRGAA